MSDTETVNSISAAVPATNGKGEEPTLTVISAGDMVNGKLVIHGDGQILGGFQGEIECAGELMIGPQAQVSANIKTVRMTLAGLVCGNVIATGRLRLASSGRLEGDARVGSLVVQEGGVHLGVIRVHPEGVPDEAESVLARAEGLAAAQAAPPAPSINLSTPVDRVKKFWGEFF
jgi:cytoskeletal protein CcmA (bactofilin family)